MEITGFIVNILFFLIMVLGGGDGSKPSVSFLNFEPKVSKFPRPEQMLFRSFTTATIIGFSDFVALFLYLLLYRLATDIRTIEEAFCVLFVEFVVDDVLAVFDSICCCDPAYKHVRRLRGGLGHFQRI